MTKFRDSSFSQLEIKVVGGQFCISLPHPKIGSKNPTQMKLQYKCKNITNKLTLGLLSFVHASPPDFIF